MKAKHVRLYSDAAGESHFEDVETPLVPQDFAPPAAPLHVGKFLPACETFWLGGPPDWGGNVPHPTPRRQIFITVAGTFEVEVSDGEVRRFPPGSVLLLEDTTGRGHCTRVVGDEDAFVFALGLRD